MKSTITLLTACNAKLSTIEGLFESIQKQTRLPDKIILLVYPCLAREEFDAFVLGVHRRYPALHALVDIISSHNSSHIPGKYHGYDRHFLVEYSSCQQGSSGLGVQRYTLMIDIDNEVEPSCIESLLEEYTALQQKDTQQCLLAPTVMRRRTGIIQSQGINGFSFLVPKYQYASFTIHDSPKSVMMMGGNCLFGSAEIFEDIQFDPLFAYSYEDIDFTYRLTQSGVALYVTASIITYHMESERSPLDKKLIGNPTSAYYRMRNYILFVRKNATLWQKIQAYGCSIWGLYCWFILNVLMYGSNLKSDLLVSISKGLRDGLMYKDPDVTKEQKH